MINREKRTKTMSEVKPVENMRKNPKFSRESSMQKELLPSHKLQDHAYKQQNPSRLKEDNPS